VTILDEPLVIGIEEETKRTEHRVAFTEQKLIDRGLGYQVASGRLTLVILNVSRIRQRFADGSKPLEEMLNRFIIGLVRAALWLKRQRADADAARLKREEEERLRQEEARRLAEAELRWREEEGRVERLERLVEMWRRHQDLERVVGDLRAAAGEVSGFRN
jgi:hypothetical protein